MIEESVIREVKERLDIVEVIGDFVSLKRSGSSYKALSPFTNEKTPHFLYLLQNKFLNVLVLVKAVMLLNF